MDRQTKKWIKHEFNKISGMLFLYKILFNLLVSFMIMLLYNFLPHTDNFLEGGIWYLISSLLCLGIFILWKKPDFFKTQILPVHSKMSAGKFLCFLGLFMLMQYISSYMYVFLEMLANHFGLSLSNSLEAATGNSLTLSMFLYSAFAAPLVEEFIFRGAVLKSLESFGKWFALLASSLVFALMHSNFAQIPFAMGAGLILGYIAMEYSIWHSILLHIANNMIFGELLPKLLGVLPAAASNMLDILITNGLILIGIIFLLRKSKNISCFIRSQNMTGRLLLWYFTTVFGILFTASSLWSACSQMIPL